MAFLLKKMKTYCESVRDLPLDNLRRKHHDSEHGSEPRDDDDLFKRLMLEISQAGLSFDTILKKKETIYAAFPTIKTVANFKEKEIDEILQNPGIIRNRLKIQAAIFNANKIIEIQNEHGSFKEWLGSQGKLSREEWTKLFKKTFKFTGGEIVNEFLMSTGHLPGAHVKGCKYYKKK